MSNTNSGIRKLSQLHMKNKNKFDFKGVHRKKKLEETEVESAPMKRAPKSKGNSDDTRINTEEN